MRAIECGCGEHIEGADAAALLRAIRAHVARDHPEVPLTDEQLHLLVAVDAYTMGAADPRHATAVEDARR